MPLNRRHFIAALATAITTISVQPPVGANARMVATYVHRSLAGGSTACGGTWDNESMIVASRSHRCGTRLRLTNPANGANIVVVVRDHSPNSQLDLTRAAFRHLAPISQGRVTVNVQVL